MKDRKEPVFRIKGNREYRKWQDNKPLSPKQAILAQCYSCNGLEESAEDCLGGDTCPLYGHFPHKRKKRVR